MATSNPKLAQLVRDVPIACERADRPDLKQRVAKVAPVDTGALRIVVIGEFRVGKGTLINALLEAEICPTASVIEPHGPIVIRYGDQPEARVVRIDGVGRAARVAPDLIRDGSFPVEVAAGIGQIEIDMPLPQLRDGLVIVDTPSSSGLSSTRAIADLDLVRDADAVLFVTSAAQPLTRSETSAIETIAALCPSITVVLNKIDFYPSWREIRAIDEETLRSAGLAVRVLPTSARLAATGGADAQVLAESGLAALRLHVQDNIARATQARRLAETLGHYREVLAQIAAPMMGELAASENPAIIDEQVRRIESEQADVERARRSIGGWQNVLTDSFEDLFAEVELQLRHEFAMMIAEAEQHINATEPVERWPETQRVAVERSRWILARTVEHVHRRCGEISTETATRIGIPDFAPLAIRDLTGGIGAEEAVGGGVSAVADPAFESVGLRERSFTGLRGAVGGLTMFSVLGTFVFPPLIAAAPIGAIVIGRKTVRDDAARSLERNRATARTTVRRFADEALRNGSAETRQLVRDGRRRLRDYYSDRVDEASRTLGRRLDGLKDARLRAVAQQKRRVDELRKELGRIEILQAMVEELAAGTPTGGPR